MRRQNAFHLVPVLKHNAICWAELMSTAPALSPVAAAGCALSQEGPSHHNPEQLCCWPPVGQSLRAIQPKDFVRRLPSYCWFLGMITPKNTGLWREESVDERRVYLHLPPCTTLVSCSAPCGIILYPTTGVSWPQEVVFFFPLQRWALMLLYLMFPSLYFWDFPHPCLYFVLDTAAKILILATSSFLIIID